MPGAIAETERMAAADPDVFLPRQFTNPDNAEAHELRTGPELVAAVTGAGARIDGFVASVGTAGTLMGVGRVVRRVNPAAAVARVVVAGESLDAEQGGPACLGIPGVVDCLSGLLDEDELGGHPPLAVPRAEAMDTTRELARAGFPVGPSSGLNVAGARALARELGPGHHVATVLCDRMERYFSTDLFDDLRACRPAQRQPCCTGGANASSLAPGTLRPPGGASMDESVNIEGTVAPGFEGVREAFAAQLHRARRGGRRVLAGPRRPPRSSTCGAGSPTSPRCRPTPRTRCSSCSRPPRAPPPSAPTCWPSGASSTSTPPSPSTGPSSPRPARTTIPVRWLLCHKAGLPYVDARRSASASAGLGRRRSRRSPAMTPIWEPGTAHGYHAVTYGWLVGEVIRRVSGAASGTFFADEVAGPLGLEFWIGLPDDQQARVAPLTNTRPRPAGARHGGRGLRGRGPRA